MFGKRGYAKRAAVAGGGGVSMARLTAARCCAATKNPSLFEKGMGAWFMGLRIFPENRPLAVCGLASNARRLRFYMAPTVKK